MTHAAELEPVALYFLDRLKREFASIGRSLADVDLAEREEVERRLIYHVVERLSEDKWQATAFLLFAAAERAREIEQGLPFSRPEIMH